MARLALPMMNSMILKLSLCTLAGAFLCSFQSDLQAADPATQSPDWMKIETDPAQKPATVSHEVNTDYSFVAGAQVRQGDRNLGNTEEQSSSFNYTASIPVAKGWQLRTGVAWDRFSFGNSPGAPIPDTLQSVALTLGADVELSEKWIMRFEVMPGISSDFVDIDANDLSLNAIVGFSYIVDSKLQWVMGLMIGYSNEYPVLPGAGVRWQFADDWTLNFILPRPRLEYKVTDQLQAFVGAEIKSGTYRVGSDFGSSVGNEKLNNAVVSYMEVRTGAGLIYRFHPAFALEAEGGWMVDRSFDYYRADTRVSGEGAPYGQIGLKANF
jgi:hypothetical protein